MRRLLVLLLVTMLGLAAAGHRPPAPRDPALAGWLVTGGSLAELCGGEAGRDHAAECAGCLPGFAALPTALVELTGRTAPVAAGAARPRPAHAIVPRAGRSGGPRGPPVA